MTETNLIEDLRLLSPPDYRWLLVALLSLMVVCGIVLLARRLRRASITGAPVAQGQALWDMALAELEQLQHLLAREHSREYGIRSTAILRRYIETRYALHAPLLATEEFLAEGARSSALPVEHRAKLARFLELCDLFKFGRYLASAEELRELHAAAIAFVVASRLSEFRSGEVPSRTCIQALNLGRDAFHRVPNLGRSGIRPYRVGEGSREEKKGEK